MKYKRFVIIRKMSNVRVDSYFHLYHKGNLKRILNEKKNLKNRIKRQKKLKNLCKFIHKTNVKCNNRVVYKHLFYYNVPNGI